MKQAFAISPPGKLAWVALIGLGGILPAVAVLLAALNTSAITKWSLPQVLPLLLVLLAIGLIVGLLSLSLRRLAVELDGNTLVVRAALYTVRLPVTDLDLEHARIQNLQRGDDNWPCLRINGMGLPGARLGHFRGRPFKRRLFCLLTHTQRVLVLPQCDGSRTLVLSLEHPQRLLDVLGRL